MYQAGDGSYAIRQGRWKLEDTPSSGGYYRVSREEAREAGLPEIQLYDLAADVGERDERVRGVTPTWSNT